ncbi:unnamed protein product, partial [Cladocopium goreaui]
LSAHLLQGCSHVLSLMRSTRMAKETLCLLYLPGCGSLPGGRKERFLQAYADKKGHLLRCLEYSKPLGAEGAWMQKDLSSLHEALRDAEAAADELTTDTHRRLVLVAASMGGWIAASLASSRFRHVFGALLLAPTAACSAAKVLPGQGGRFSGTDLLPSQHSDQGYTIHGAIRQELQEHTIEDRIPASCLVRIMHGDKDEAIPMEASEMLQLHLKAKGVKAELRRVTGGDHRLSSEVELAILEEELDQLLFDLGAGEKKSDR